MKKLILPIMLLLSVIALISFIPTIQRGQKVEQLEHLKAERARCEITQATMHDKANQLRIEFGFIEESWITPEATAPQGQIIDWTGTE